MLVTPLFWSKRCSLISLLLVPFSWLYQLVVMIRNVRVKPYRSHIPIICIGNATVGGTGKTPISMKIATLLQEYNMNIIFLSKGYKGSISSATIVSPDGHSALEVGDEPLLLARIAPVIVAKDRVEGVKLAESLEPDIIIMDDGLQNPKVEKDLALLVVDMDYRFGNRRIFPSGPLRESVSSAMGKVDAVIAIGEHAKSRLQSDVGDKPMITARLIPSYPVLEEQSPRVFAFTGIGRPDKFFDMLTRDGYKLVNKHPYPDHFIYTEYDEYRLNLEAEAFDAHLFTTEKDFIKLSPSMQQNTHVVTIDIVIDEHVLMEILRKL